MIDYVAVVPFYPLNMLEKEDYFMYPASLLHGKGYHSMLYAYRRKGEKNFEILNGVIVRRFDNFAEMCSNLPSGAFVHCHTLLIKMVPIYLLLARKEQPKILTLHSSIGYGLSTFLKVKFHKIFKSILKRFDLLITTNPCETKFFSSNGFNNIIEIPLPIDYQYFQNAKDYGIFRRAYNLGTATILLCIGHNKPVKNLSTIMKAFNLIKRKQKASVLCVMGEITSPQKKEIIEALEKPFSNDVIFTGRLSPYSRIFLDIFGAASIFINSSLNEGQCISVFEAAASGLPLCLSNIGPFKSVFKDNALYHSPKDFKQLAANLLRYYDDAHLYRKHQRAVKRVVQEYDFEYISQQLWEVYAKILQNKSFKKVQF